MANLTVAEVGTVITKRQAVHEEELLAEHQLDQQVLRLRAEKENVLDVVWLATSSSQVRELWTKVGRPLGDEPSELECEALAIPVASQED